jgi:hypothetical protein
MVQDVLARYFEEDGFRVSPIKTSLDSAKVRRLLSRLCVRLGFCLPAFEIERLATSLTNDSDEFPKAALLAEGYGVAKSDPIFNQARELVAQAFVRHQSETEL